MEENKTEEVQTNEQPITEQPTEEVVSEPVQLGSNPVQTEEVTPVVEQPVVEQPVVDPVPVQPIKRRKKDIIGYNPETGEPIYKEYAPGEIPPKKSKKGLIITIIILVLLIVGGLTTWLLLSNNGDSDTDEPKTEEKDNKKDEDKKEKKGKKIYFYRYFEYKYGYKFYGMTYGYDVPEDDADLLATYECKTDECEVAKETVTSYSSTSEKVNFANVVIHESDYDYLYNGKEAKKINLKKGYSYGYFENNEEEVIPYYESGDDSTYALYSMLANKSISGFEYDRLGITNYSLYVGDKVVRSYKKKDGTYDYYDIKSGSKMTEEHISEIMSYISNYLNFNGGNVPRLIGSINYIKEYGLTDELMIISVGLAIDGVSAEYKPALEPNPDECSLTSSDGKEIKCNELTLFDSNKIDDAIYQNYGRHLDKKDCGKYCKYISSIDAYGIDLGSMYSNSTTNYSIAVSYKINSDKASVKYALMSSDDAKDYCKLPYSYDCYKYIYDKYDVGKAKTYTMNLVWDTDHYYLDDISFDK